MLERFSSQSFEHRPQTTTNGRHAGIDPLESNRLLGALPLEARRRLIEKMQRVPLKRRQVLQERNLPLEHGYFIEKGTAAVFARSSGSKSVEIRTVGPSDFVGLSLVLGTQNSSYRCIVQIPGEALQISAEGLSEATNVIPGLKPLLLAYVHAALAQSSQLALCGTCHSVEQRIARSLLSLADQTGSNKIALTHEALGKSLGVRRASVTSVIGKLTRTGLIEPTRGSIQIIDIGALEQVSCACYRAIRSAYERALPMVRPHGGRLHAGTRPSSATC